MSSVEFAYLKDYRYTDQDVREHPYLEPLARSYLQSYGGDFSFLVAAKLLVESGGVLSTAVTRGVLNCMRADPTAPVPPARSRPVLRTVNPRRPARVRLKASFKRPWLSSRFPTARYAHELHPGLTELWWFPHIERYEWYPRVWCGVSLSRAQQVNTWEIPEGRTACLRCARAKGEIDGG